MNTLRTTDKSLKTTSLSLYDQYGAMAYGVILQIIPQEKLAQEVLVELFNSPSLLNCQEGISDAICIIRNARAKALEFSTRLNALVANNEEATETNTDSLPNLIFNLAFKQGLSLDIIAVKLGLSKEATMKAISHHVKSFRKS